MNASVGEVVGPVETQFGYHIIQVTDRATQEVQIADLAHRIRADVTTLNNIQERLDDLQYYASEDGNFTEEAQRLGLTTQQAQIQADQQFIPGLGNSRTIMNFLDDAGDGDVSEVIELNDQFVVLAVQDVQPEGYRSFDEVRAELEPRARTAKKAEMQAARLERALENSSFEELPNAVGERMRTARGLGYNNPVVPGLGREPQFTGTALGLDEGERSRVIEGETAAYVLEVTDVHEPPPMSESQREQLRNQLIEQRTATIRNQWLAELREKAEVDDNRRFFRQ